MDDEELYECHNWNKDGKICGYKGSNRHAKKCPMCGGTLNKIDWFVERIEVGEYE